MFFDNVNDIVNYNDKDKLSRIQYPFICDNDCDENEKKKVELKSAINLGSSIDSDDENNLNNNTTIPRWTLCYPKYIQASYIHYPCTKSQKQMSRNKYGHENLHETLFNLLTGVSG